MNYQFIWGWGKLTLNHPLKIQILLMLFVNWCDFFLLSLFYVFSLMGCYLMSFRFPCCLCDWLYDCCARTL